MTARSTNVARVLYHRHDGHEWEGRFVDNGLWELHLLGSPPEPCRVLRAWAWPTSGGKARWTCGPFNREEESMEVAVAAAIETAFTGTPPPLPSVTPDDDDDADEDSLGFIEPEDDPTPDDLLVFDVADEAAEKAIKRFVAEAGATFTNGSDGGPPITELKPAPVTFDEFAMACEEVSRLRDRVRVLEGIAGGVESRLATLEMIRLQSDAAFSRIRERLDAIAANDADRDARMAPALTVTWHAGLKLTWGLNNLPVLCVYGPDNEHCVLIDCGVRRMDNVVHTFGDQFDLSHWTIVHE